jgi:hypothetical protein
MKKTIMTFHQAIPAPRFTEAPEPHEPGLPTPTGSALTGGNVGRVPNLWPKREIRIQVPKHGPPMLRLFGAFAPIERSFAPWRGETAWQLRRLARLPVRLSLIV